jgi:hypothetical protein
MNWEILEGDCREVLASLPERSVQTVVTSPPYFGLRDYGTGEWEGGENGCDHIEKASARNDLGPDDLARRAAAFATGTGSGSQVSAVQFKHECGKCGARRVDCQIGLEPSPDEYVAALVSVFREVRRVLRDDGTVWLNLGDSYATTHHGKHNGSASEAFNDPGDAWRENVVHERREKAIPSGCKPKDLIGIPWMVAEALKAPYYAGTIKDERDRIWLAAMIDAEGCMFIHKRKVGQSNGQGYVRRNDSYGAGLEISSTDRVIVENVARITGRGSICQQTPEQNERRKQTIYRWNLRSNECREVIREVYPYLVAKQHEARLVLGCPSSGPDAERAHVSLKAIHQGGQPGIDFPAPESMFERGWFLRSDIIWSKLDRTRCPRASRTGLRKRTSTCSCCRRGHGTSTTLTRSARGWQSRNEKPTLTRPSATRTGAGASAFRADT